MVFRAEGSAAGITREDVWGGWGWAMSWEQGQHSRPEQRLEVGMSMALQRAEDLDLFGAKGLFWR